ncbi:MAG TPA: carboxypeptidase regulatory-like domain-containing protein [Verrucomicrobiae bacterium]|nr:carboxypeptidase regulatory-like domain-containing protein [Verrucomicrobiae bacterium]
MIRTSSLLSVVLMLASVSFSQPGRDQLLQSPFKAGVTHVDGKYAFTDGNFLVEGSQRISTYGSDAIFIYLEPNFRTRYPDKSGPLWPTGDLQSMTELAQTDAYKSVFNLPFKVFVITAYAFGTQGPVQNFATDPNLAAREEQEFYDLTRYLLTTYAGTGKTFILKHWEGDYIGLGNFDTSKDISPAMVDAMNVWLTARQRGVTRARNGAGNPAGVAVFNAVEMSRVLDYSRLGKTRVVNAVIPVVKPDMVSYSAYDSTLGGTDPASAAASINEALNVIKSFAPDPLGLGDKRILISEYGLFENERPADEVAWRATTILQTSQGSGIFGAFLWQVFDNECKQSDGTYFPTASSPGAALRPANTQCRGLWLVKPDGSTSPVSSLISPYWKSSTSGNAITGRVTSAANESGIGGAKIAFYGGEATADSSGNYQLPNVPGGNTQLTARASGYQNYSIVVASGTQNTANFALIPSNAAGSVTGKVTSAIDGTARSGVTVNYSGGSTTTNSSGAFTFSALPGGTYDFTAQLSGWVPVTIRATVQPATASVLNFRIATGAKLAGRVTNSAGAPLVGASINLHGGLAPTNVTVKTDSNGNYDSGWVAIGNYQAVASASGYALSAASVTLSTGVITTKNFVLGTAANFAITASPASQTITSGQPTTYTVQVTPAQGFTSAVTLSASGLPTGASASFNPASITSGASTLTVSTASTTPAGTYTLSLNGSGGGVQHSAPVSLVVNAPVTKGSASGRVTRASDGSGISGATVSSSSGSTTTDSSGNFTLSNLPAGSVQLTASAGGFTSMSKTITIVAGQTTSVSFALVANTTGSITGRITSAINGAAIAGATVSYSRGSTTSDANGNYSFRSVPAGTYTVTAQKSGWIAASTTVTVGSGAATANIKLATGGKITGKVVNASGSAISGATVKMTGGLVATSMTMTTNSSGVYTSPWIAIGSYSVRVSKSGYTAVSKTVSVSTGATATLNFTLR